jgi:nucleotide-binding universal stress UspA family protein
MNGFRNILVPLDRSEIAEQAITVAASIARRSGGMLRLVSVEEPLPALAFASDSLEVAKDLEVQEHGQLAGYLESIATAVQDVQGEKVESAMLHGPVAGTLSQYADDNAVDLIVMTTRGRGAVTRWLIGSTADRLLRSVHVPLLLLHPREPPWPISFRRILVALDGEMEEPVVTSAVALGWVYPEAHYTLTRVVEPSLPVVAPLSPYPIAVEPERMKQREAEARTHLQSVCGRLRDSGLDATYKVLVGGGGAAQVLQLASTVLADCVVVGTHSRRGIPRLVRGSKAERIVHGATLPVLIVPVRDP